MANETPPAPTGTFGLQQPPQLDFDNTTEWPAWIEHFDDYRFATGINERTGEAQVRTLLYTMGRQAREIFATFDLSAEEAKDFDLVKRKFDEHFVKERNVVYESACFHRRLQKPGESVDQYVTALHVLADRCEFGEMKQRMIRDRFVVGLHDDKLSENLQMDAKLTLSSALAKARLKEVVHQQQRELRSGEPGQQACSSTKEDLNVDAVSRRRDAPRRKVYGSETSHRDKQCSFCGGDQHPRSVCPARAQKCFNCHTKGHFSRACRKESASSPRKVQVSSVQQETGELFLGAINVPDAKARYVQITLNSVPVFAKVDSGAEATLVPSTFPGIPFRLETASEVLTGAGENRLTVLGKFKAKLIWKDKVSMQTVYVVSPLRQVLLGLPAIEALGVVNFIDGVSLDKQNYDVPAFLNFEIKHKWKNLFLAKIF
ncbi:uncharacterized protein LOC121835999 [Ixodes scapularis]|uniref:uncharacterized protein LOC121835999 n=1 Tax=Ixodes scapularis TaxID=6945 RepID=UPI001C382883|nr:uncharacterized protein LOC121835999 [Ixodes scapularis]